MARNKQTPLKMDLISTCSDQTSPKSWYQEIRDVLLSTVHQCQPGVSYVCPSVRRFSMTCEAQLERTTDDNDIDDVRLVVKCCRTEDGFARGAAGSYSDLKFVTKSEPRLVTAGDLRIRVTSDLLQGHVDSSLSQTVRDFRGCDFSRRFECKLKGKLDECRTDIARVIVEELAAHEDTPRPVFDFIISKAPGSGCKEDRSSVFQQTTVDCSWSTKAVRQLAAALHLYDDNNWRRLATHLGFTETEISAKIQGPTDPFDAMLDTYRVRGGTPTEFDRAVSAVLSGTVSVGLVPSTSVHGVGCAGTCVKSSAVRALKFNTPLMVDVDDNSSGLNQEELQYHVQRTTGAGLQMMPYAPLTPPTTPRKRPLEPPTNTPPTKRPKTATSVFLFPDDNDLDETHFRSSRNGVLMAAKKSSEP